MVTLDIRYYENFLNILLAKNEGSYYIRGGVVQAVLEKQGIHVYKSETACKITLSDEDAIMFKLLYS